MTGYRFERLNESLMPDLAYLYRDAFHAGVTAEFLQLKYDTSFTGIKYVGYVAYDENDSPAAYYGVFPLFAQYRGETVLAAQSGDTMTHSAHRGKGLFYSLASEALSLAKELGINFVYGFPNMHNSYYGLMKLKWTHNGNMNRYRLFVPAFPLSVTAGRIPYLLSVFTKRAAKTLNKYSSSRKSFPNPLVESGYLGVKRDDAYFEYKNYYKKHIIELEGKCVWVKAGKTLQAGDIELCSEADFYKIISGLKKIAFSAGMPAVTFQFSPGTVYDNYLSKRYKAQESLPVCYINLSGEYDLKNIRFSSADFDTF